MKKYIISGVFLAIISIVVPNQISRAEAYYPCNYSTSGQATTDCTGCRESYPVYCGQPCIQSWNNNCPQNPTPQPCPSGQYWDTSVCKPFAPDCSQSNAALGWFTPGCDGCSSSDPTYCQHACIPSWNNNCPQDQNPQPCPSGQYWNGSVCNYLYQDNYQQHCLQIANAQWLGNDTCRCAYGYEIVPQGIATIYGGNNHYQFSCRPTAPTPVPPATYCDFNKEYIFNTYAAKCVCPMNSTYIDIGYQNWGGQTRFKCVSTYTQVYQPYYPNYPTYKTCSDGSVIPNTSTCPTAQNQCANNQVWNGYTCQTQNTDDWMLYLNMGVNYGSGQYTYDEMPATYNWNNYQTGYTY